MHTLAGVISVPVRVQRLRSCGSCVTILELTYFTVVYVVTDGACLAAVVGDVFEC